MSMSESYFCYCWLIFYHINETCNAHLWLISHCHGNFVLVLIFITIFNIYWIKINFNNFVNIYCRSCS